MNTLIVYMTHHGTTRKVVDRLVNGINTGTTHAVDLEKNESPEFSGYDSVIIGGSIHIGQIQPRIKRFCEQHKETLLGKKLGLFICFMNQELAKQEFDNAYPEELRNHATAKGLFGGELLMEKMNLIEKFMVSKVGKESKSKSQINYEAIDEFIKVMQ